VDNVLGKQNALELKEEEVEELLQVGQNPLQSILRNGVVFTGTERAG
jgi:hypothetical protein